MGCSEDNIKGLPVTNSNEPQWLTWARRIQGIAQTGRHYTENDFDRERYEQLEALAVEIIDTYTADIENPTLTGIFKTEDGYATPKLDVRGVVFNKDGDVLLVREKLDGDKWTLPGGWADVNMPPSENVEREVIEESGYKVRPVKILACYDRRLHGHPPYMFHLYKLFFRCELLDETPIESPQGNLETTEAKWFAEDDLPADDELSIGRVTNKQLHRFYEHLRHPEWATEFD
jgi:ADP-ribose pyrophosphatase YjhB (NUDIX family)